MKKGIVLVLIFWGLLIAGFFVGLLLAKGGLLDGIVPKTNT